MAMRRDSLPVPTSSVSGSALVIGNDMLFSLF
jgi:hypothetical protein